MRLKNNPRRYPSLHDKQNDLENQKQRSSNLNRLLEWHEQVQRQDFRIDCVRQHLEISEEKRQNIKPSDSANTCATIFERNKSDLPSRANLSSTRTSSADPKKTKLYSHLPPLLVVPSSVISGVLIMPPRKISWKKSKIFVMLTRVQDQ